jgi:hypothetical protein
MIPRNVAELATNLIHHGSGSTSHGLHGHGTEYKGHHGANEDSSQQHGIEDGKVVGTHKIVDVAVFS